MNLYRLLAFICCFPFVLHGQGPADSLRQAIAAAADDTNKVDMMIELGKKYFNSSPEEAIRVSEEALALAGRLGYRKGEGYALKNVGLVHYIQYNSFEALQAWRKSLAVFEAISYRPGEANLLQNIGTIYFYESNDEKALDFYLRALKIADELADSLRIAEITSNIGAIYGKKKGTYEKSIEYASRALAINEKLGNMDAVGTTASNIGEVYMWMGDDTTALSYFKKSVRAYKDSEYLPYALNNMGWVYAERQEFDRAIRYHEEALIYARNLDAKIDIVQSYKRLGQAYQANGEYRQAIVFYREGMPIGIEMKAYEDLKKIYEGLTECHARIEDYDNAFKYQQMLLDVKDTIFDQETNRKLDNMMFGYQIDQKENEIQLQDQEIKRQKFVRNSFIGGFGVVLLFAGIFLAQRNRISKEKKRSEELLLNILPEETAEELKATGSAKTKSFDAVTVLFTDFKNFTQASEKLTPEELVAEINHCYSAFDKIVSKYGIEKIKTIGDAYMCAGGLPVANRTHPEDVIRAGLEMQEFIVRNKEERARQNLPFFELRLGIHTGPVVAGIVGIKKFAYDIWGDTVNTASRMESSGEVGKVNISGETYALAKERFRCTHRGKVKAKHKGEIDMYFVEGPA